VKKNYFYRSIMFAGSVMLVWLQNASCSNPQIPTCGGSGCPPCKLYCIWKDSNPYDDEAGFERFFFYPIQIPGKGWSCCGFSHPPCDDYGFNTWHDYWVKCDDKRTLEEQICISKYERCSYKPSTCSGVCWGFEIDDYKLTGSDFDDWFKECMLPRCEETVEKDML